MNIFQRQGIADFGQRTGAAHHHFASLEPIRSDDVSAFAAGVLEQSNPRTSDGIVLDPNDLGWDAVLLPFEIDQADHLLVTLSTPAAGDSAVAVSPASFLAGQQQLFLGPRFRDLIERGDGDVSRRRCQGAESSWRHSGLSVMSG